MYVCFLFVIAPTMQELLLASNAFSFNKKSNYKWNIINWWSLISNPLVFSDYLWLSLTVGPETRGLWKLCTARAIEINLPVAIVNYLNLLWWIYKLTKRLIGRSPNMAVDVVIYKGLDYLQFHQKPLKICILLASGLRPRGIRFSCESPLSPPRKGIQKS